MSIHEETRATIPAMCALVDRVQMDDWAHLIAESEDWGHIVPAFVEFIAAVQLDPEPQRALRALVEIVYVLGYERGKREATMPRFVVAQELEETP